MSESVSRLMECMDIQFRHAQDVPDNDPLRHQKVAARMARYIGYLEGLVITVISSDNGNHIQYAIDRLKEPL